MLINRIILDSIPQSIEGQKVAEEYEKKLREMNAFKERKDSTNSIQIWAEYSYELNYEGD